MIENPPMKSSPVAAPPGTRPTDVTGDPRSTRASPTLPAQFIHCSMPASACSGEAFAIWSVGEVVERYSNRYLVIDPPEGPAHYFDNDQNRSSGPRVQGCVDAGASSAVPAPRGRPPP